MTRPRIFITQPVAQSAVDRLRAVADVALNPDTAHIVTQNELLAAVRDCDILFCLLHDRIDRDVILAGSRLRAIASMKITPSDIDVAAATARRIPVTVISPIVTEATADIHFALLLAVARRVVEGDRLVRAGVFPGAQSAHLLGAGVYGKTIGLIGGGGRIGRAVAQRAHGFSMRTLYWTPRRKPEHEEQQVGLIYVPYDEDYGYVTLEAFLAGKPVITATDSGGTLEFVRDEHNGFVCAPEPEAVGRAIARLAANPGLAAELGERGRARAAQITWDGVVEQLVG